MVCISLLCACDTTPSSSDVTHSSNGTGGSMARFTCKGDYLYVVDENNLTTYNVSDSSKIVLKSRTFVGGAMETIFPADSMLFIGSKSGMFIFNLKKPAVPEFLSRYNHITSCDPVVVQGKYAYITLHSSEESWSLFERC